MDLPVMKYLTESMRNTADVLLQIMQDGKTFVCDECFGGNFEPCEHNEPNAIRMMAGGKESWWCCGYCRLKYQNTELKNHLKKLLATIDEELNVDEMALTFRTIEETNKQHNEFVKALIRCVAFYANPATYQGVNWENANQDTPLIRLDTSAHIDHPDGLVPGFDARVTLEKYRDKIFRYDVCD